MSKETKDVGKKGRRSEVIGGSRSVRPKMKDL